MKGFLKARAFVMVLVLFMFGFVVCGVVFSDTVKILVPRSTSSVPFFLLADRGTLDEAGVKVKVEVFINHAQALARLIRGDVDFLYTGTSQGWQNWLNGGKIVMIDTGIWGVSYLVGKDASIKSFGDLKGKKIALPFPGSPLDFQTRYIMVKEGLNPDSDVSISYMPFNQTIAMLIKGKIDAAPLPEPLVTNLVVNKGLLRLVDYKKAWARVNGGNEKSPQVSLFALRSTVKRDKELIEKLVRAWRSASEEVTKEPMEMGKKYASWLSMPGSIVGNAVGNTLYYVPSFKENKREVIEYYNLMRQVLKADSKDLGDDFFFLGLGN